MGFVVGVFSKVKRLLCSWQVKKKCSDESVIINPEHEYTAPDFGSKEDSFFDTRVWLDSDCEDDFHSVNGEFTPGSITPNRYNAPLRTPHKNLVEFDEILPDSEPSPSPSDKKKLAELLQDSLNEQVGNEQPNGSINIEGKGAVKPDEGMNGKSDIKNEEMNLFSTSCEGTPKPKKEKLSLTASCCLPGLVSGMTSKKKKIGLSH